MSKLLFKEADNSDEFEQIHALNHRIFAAEIGQHEMHPSGLLVDRFHHRNRYFIAVENSIVIGMISAHPGPDFSIARRLPDPGVLQRLDRPIEIRLLAIDPAGRNRTVLAGLLWQAYDFAASSGFSHLLISGISERETMYRKLGFVPLGPAVAEGAATFIPMVMEIREQRRTNLKRVRLHQRHWDRSFPVGPAANRPTISLMPGPVSVHPHVASRFACPPVSHRSAAFIDLYEQVRAQLRWLLAGMEVALFPGGGTLANDVVAANLRALFAENEGLVISNGEFGERIANQAAAAGLRFHHLRLGWGETWPFAALSKAIDRKPAWVWAVHLETSIGILNDVETLLALAHASNSAVALDCVSSVGAAPLPEETNSLLFASGVSGKSIGSYAGLAFVYLSEECKYRLARHALCPSFDLLRMHAARGPVSTISSPTLFALAAALELHYASAGDSSRRFQQYSRLGEFARCEMRAIGLEPFVSESVAAPNITTFSLPFASFPQRCLEAGYHIAHESSYLESRGWGQIATMGNITPASLIPLFRALASNLSTAAQDPLAFATLTFDTPVDHR